MLRPARRLIGRRQATSRDASSVPSKQRVAGSNPAGRVITVTERKASLLIDVARAFFQRGKYEQAHAALRATKDTAPQEVAARPSVATLARDLATLAPANIRREAEQFATRIGAPR
jgi:hypothetical protein